MMFLHIWKKFLEAAKGSKVRREVRPKMVAYGLQKAPLPQFLLQVWPLIYWPKAQQKGEHNWNYKLRLAENVDFEGQSVY